MSHLICKGEKYKNLSKLTSVQKTLLNTTNEYLLELYNWKISAEKLYKNVDRNKKVKNLFYAGQLTVPGPGVPPSIISGKVVSDLLMKNLNNKKA